MKQIRGYLVTTKPDLHGERVDLGELLRMQELFQHQYGTITQEHDPRVAPVGRVVSSRVVPLQDGEYGLETTAEIWEVGDSLDQLSGDGRRAITSAKAYDTFGVLCDLSYLENSEELAFVNDLAKLAGKDVEPTYYVKKAEISIAYLIIAAGVFVVTL